MKIAWFTPFSKNSAIGKYSQSITNELIKECEVDLWLSATDVDPLFTELKIFYYSREDLLDKLKGYDFIIYNMGNYLPFHKDIYEASNKIKGVVILHDFVMHHFFAAYYLHKGSKEAYINDIEKLYGMNIRDIALASINGKRTPLWETEEVIEYPFFEKAIEGAIGVVTHSQFHADKVRQKFLGPVDVIYHPFYSYSSSIANNPLKKADLGIPEDKILIISVGHVNPNKRIDKVIEVLGKHKDLAEKVIYVIVGPYNHQRYYSELKSIIERYNLYSIVRFLGYQPDDLLNAYLMNADVAVNLRYPTIEGAPGSLIEQLYFGKPIIVNNTGFYSEIPDACVIKVNVDEMEEENLYHALKNLVYDRDLRKRIGLKARQFATENFTPKRYCENFIKFLKRVGYWKPVLKLIDRISTELSLMGVTEDAKIVCNIAEEIYRLTK